jgi:hypothetical protein
LLICASFIFSIMVSGATELTASDSFARWSAMAGVDPFHGWRLQQRLRLLRRASQQGIHVTIGQGNDAALVLLVRR